MLSEITQTNVLQNIEEYRNEYNRASPFPHAVLDNFLDESVLNKCLSSIETKAANIGWLQDEHWAQKNKKWIQSCKKMPEDASRVVWWMNSSTMLSFIASLTGIKDIIPDCENEGGGIHYSAPGGKLNTHVDFNFHGKLGIKRRINALLFLNKNWDPSWEGKLELWKTDRSECEVEIEPVFSRLVVFNTTDDSYHGVSKGIHCPQDRRRISIAMYYYTFESQENLPEQNKRTSALFYQ